MASSLILVILVITFAILFYKYRKYKEKNLKNNIISGDTSLKKNTGKQNKLIKIKAQ